MRTRLDIDVGELPNEPEALYATADIVNVACGGHAGDDESMRLAAERAGRHGAEIAAHPSYPDRAGFGRVAMELPLATLAASVRAQCAALRRITEVRWMKPHGALYHRADADPDVAEVVVTATVAALGPVGILGPPGGALAEVAARRGLPFLREGFADRGILPDGRLVPRGQPGAVITDPLLAAAQARQLAERFDVLCVHGDQPSAEAVARAVRAALDEG